MTLKEFYSLEAEQSILGSLIGIDSEDVISKVDLKHSDFFLSKHRYLFKAIESLIEKDVIPDIVGVTEWLQSANVLQEFGTMELFEMAESAIIVNFEYHQKIIKDKSRFRTVQKTLARMQEKLFEADDADQLEIMLSKGIDVLANQGQTKKTTFTSIHDIMFDLVEDMQIEKGEIQGIPSAFTELDKMTSGFKDGDFVVIGARPSMGKTAFGLNLTVGAAESGALVAVYSLEMKNMQLGRRMLSAKSNVDSKIMKEGGSRINNDNWTKLGIGAGELSNLDIQISDVSGVTVNQIKQDMIKLRKMNPDRKILCLIDYLQLIKGGKEYAGNRNQEISDISRTLKTTALDYNIVMVALSQLSRGVEQRQDKRPLMSDLRESGSIEQDADIIGFLYREDYYDRETDRKNIVELIISKNRDGEIGTVELAFIKEFGKMVNLERRFGNE